MLRHTTDDTVSAVLKSKCLEDDLSEPLPAKPGAQESRNPFYSTSLILGSRVVQLSLHCFT